MVYPAVAVSSGVLWGCLAFAAVAVAFGWGGRTFLSHIEPLRDEYDRITGVIGVAVDITARKATEKALAQNEARHRALLTAIPDVMFRLNRDGKIIEFIDRLLAPSADY